jgi:hypothetical protein
MIEPDPVEVRDASEGGQHDIGLELPSVIQPHDYFGETVENRLDDLGGSQVAAAHGLESQTKTLAQRRIQKPERFGGFVNERDLAAERREYGRVLAGDDAAAEYDHGARQVGQAQNRVAIEHVLVIDLDIRDVTRTRARRNEDARGAHLEARTVEALHVDAIGALQAS